MQFRPLHDRVLVERVKPTNKTVGGIILPDTAQEKPSEGKVVAVGSGARNEKGEVVPLAVKAGDLVLFGKWSGTEVKVDGVDLLIMNESDLMGVLSGSKKAAPAKKVAPANKKVAVKKKTPMKKKSAAKKK